MLSNLVELGSQLEDSFYDFMLGNNCTRGYRAGKVLKRFRLKALFPGVRGSKRVAAVRQHRRHELERATPLYKGGTVGLPFVLARKSKLRAFGQRQRLVIKSRRCV